jgi:hypothetical protein
VEYLSTWRICTTSCLPKSGVRNRCSSRNVVFSSYLEFRTMDRVQEPTDSEWLVLSWNSTFNWATLLVLASDEAQGSVTPLKSGARRDYSQQEFNLVQLSLHSLELQPLAAYPMSFSWRAQARPTCSSWTNQGTEWNVRRDADGLREGCQQSEA